MSAIVTTGRSGQHHFAKLGLPHGDDAGLRRIERRVGEPDARQIEVLPGCMDVRPVYRDLLLPRAFQKLVVRLIARS